MSCSVIIRSFWRRKNIIHPSAHGNAEDMGGTWKYETNEGELLRKTTKILFFNNNTNSRNLHVVFVVFASWWFIFLYNEEFCCEVLSSIHRKLPKFLRMGNLFMEWPCVLSYCPLQLHFFISVTYWKCRYLRQLLIESYGITTIK
jgi:hypothetical protein